MSTKWSNSVLGLAAFFAAGELLAQQQPIPADIGVTMTATPSTGLHTGQVIDIALTATNYGPEPADSLELDSSYFYHEFSITNIDLVACYQFGGSMSDGVLPVFDAFWIIAGVPGTGMQPLAVGETRTCRFQLVLMADAPQVTPFSFGVSTFYSDINSANNIATVYLQRAITAVPLLGRSAILLLIALVSLAGAVGAGARARLQHIG
jgi:hypothetical protein